MSKRRVLARLYPDRNDVFWSGSTLKIQRRMEIGMMLEKI